MASQKLRVRVNPGLHTDDKGRPCCAVPLDPTLPSYMPGRYVGAKAIVAPHSGPIVTVGGLTSDPGIFEQNDVTWEFDTDTIHELENTAWYRQQIKDGALTPADAQTAQTVGVPFIQQVSRKASVKE